MRILNVTASYAPFLEFGGPPVKVHALSEGLAKRGHSVTVLTPDWGIEQRLNNASAAPGRSPFGWKIVENGVTAIYLPTWLRWRALSWNPAAKRYCRARLQDFDVVHIFGLYDLLGPSVGKACRARGIPHVVEPIGMFVPIVRNIWLKRMYHAVLGRQLLWGAAAVIATSEQEVEELSGGGLLRETIAVRRNGVEPPSRWPPDGAFRRAYGIPADAKVLLFLGRLSRKKSPELLLSAVAALPAQLRQQDIRIVFAGPDEDGVGKQLMREASHVSLENRVCFTGPLFGEAKWAAYRGADVFVLPSQNENFGNSAAESVLAGTPVIVTEQCGIAPLLADQAGLVVKHETASIANALARIWSEAGLRERLASGCAEVTARLGWDEPVQEMEALYERLLKRKTDRTPQVGN